MLLENREREQLQELIGIYGMVFDSIFVGQNNKKHCKSDGFPDLVYER